MNTKNKCVIQGKPGENRNRPECSPTAVREFLDRFGFPVGKIGYRNLLLVLELMSSNKSPATGDVNGIYFEVSRNTGRSVSSIRQSIRSVIIWAWEIGSLKDAFPNQQKRPRLIEIYYWLQNHK
jgi:hypothetical protein